MTSTYGCPHCGRSNPIEARLCAYCGTILEDVESSLAARPEADDATLDAADDPSLTATPTAEETDPTGSPVAAGDRTAITPPADDSGAPASRSILSPPPSEIPEKSAADQALEDELTVWLERFPAVTAQPAPVLDDELRRQLRQMFAAEVPLTDAPSAAGTLDGAGLWRRSWIYWLLVAILGGALLLGNENDTLPHAWPGIAPVYNTIEALPNGVTVLVDWAYDPATAGEMDLVAEPVLEHLLAHNANLVVISQLPLGPATARRLLAKASQGSGAVAARRLETVVVEGGFLPGGAATLALLGQSPAVGLPLDLQGRAAEMRPALATLAEDGPVLSLVVSARSEPVQRWLEQVQPQNGVPVIAVTSAAAAPVLQPYVDSGQLVGVVSGYNGGIVYRELMLRALPRAEQEQLWRQINGHNWALAALLIVIVAANVALSFERRSP